MNNPIELALIGPLLLGDSLALEKVDELSQVGFNSKHFQSHACRAVWEHVRELLAKSAFTCEKLLDFCLNNERVGIDPVERSMWIAEAQKSGLAVNMTEHALTLMERSLRQETLEAIDSVPKDSAQQILDELENKIFTLRSKATHTQTDEKLEGIKELQEELTLMAQGKRVMRSSHVDIWDKTFGGLPDAQLIILAGRPGGGKTSLAEQLIDSMVRNGEPCLYVQRELSRSRAVGRLAARKAGVAWSRFETKTMNRQQVDQLYRSIKEYERLPLYLAPVKTCNAATLAPLIRYHARHHGVKFVVMDYVQLIDVPRGMERRVAIGEVTRSLKLTANETKATIIAIAQLSRDTDKGDKPTLSSLKESGDIEQDADVVLALWCKENRDGMDCWPVSWTILKNRNGSVGTGEVMFDGPSMTFKGKAQQLRVA